MGCGPSRGICDDLHHGGTKRIGCLKREQVATVIASRSYKQAGQSYVARKKAVSGPTTSHSSSRSLEPTVVDASSSPPLRAAGP